MYEVMDEDVKLEFTVVRDGKDLIKEDIPVILNPDTEPPTPEDIEDPDKNVQFNEGMILCDT